jgi:putative DNA primase/helicase
VYDPGARAPRWEQFLIEIFNGDLELIEFIQRAVGYSMTGHTREQAFFILHGGGRNGKGRFVKQLMAILGDLARTTRFQTFTAKGQSEGGGNTPSLAALVGARLVSVGEPDQGVRLSESTIKSLTGEDEIEVCKKHENPFTYIPICKIWVHCNHKPVIRGTDEGMWDRPRLVPFLMSFMSKEDAEKKGIPEEMRRDPDKKLDAKLTAERAGIFAWAVRGAMKWYAQGLGRCKVVDDATDQYRTESDQLGPFVEERIKQDPGKFVSNGEMFEAYTNWCRANLIEHPMAGQTLSKQLSQRGFRRGKNAQDVRGFHDVSLNKMPALFSIANR